MNAKVRKAAERRKRNLRKRLDRKAKPDNQGPVLSASGVVYEMSGRVEATVAGGLGLVHEMVRKVGLDRAINEHAAVLKQQRPYHDSDHVLSIAYSLLAGGTCLEDLGLFRQDGAILNALGALRLPAVSTAGDYLRRFQSREQIDALQDVINSVRKRLWLRQDKAFLEQAIINVDGTIAPTLGDCKQGTDFSYKGDFGYHALVVSLHNTREPLFLVNRPGNVASHHESAHYIDRAIDLVHGTFSEVKLRGDTDFSLTAHLDKWDERCTFYLGVDARPHLVAFAESLDPGDWSPLKRDIPDEDAVTRARPENVRDQKVREREYKVLRLKSEEVAEFKHHPAKCKKAYRIVVVRKNISVEKGDSVLFDEIRYFFYITNDEIACKENVVYFANERADHENDIDQLKNGVGAMKLPTGDLHSNGAYMVIAGLAWTLKAWVGLLAPKTEPDKKGRTMQDRILRMEFRTFVRRFMLHACQVLRQGRRIICRLLGFNECSEDLLRMAEAIHGLRC